MQAEVLLGGSDQLRELAQQGDLLFLDCACRCLLAVPHSLIYCCCCSLSLALSIVDKTAPAPASSSSC